MAEHSKTRWQPIALVGGVLVLYLLSVRTPQPPEGWTTDFDEAIAEARATDRHLLLAFNMRGCGPCSVMDRHVLPEPSVLAAMAAYVPVRVDVDRQATLARRFRVMGTPTYAVVDVEGTVLRQCSGFQPVDEFLTFLAQVPTPSVVDVQ